MGMAASQARLLTITARMHDVEYQAQSIQNAKLALATKQDEVYQKFVDATSATTLVAKDYQGNKITATFNNLCGINAGDFVVPNSKNGRYVIVDDKNRLIVPDDVAQDYYDFMEAGFEKDPYAFAAYVLTGGAIDQFDMDALMETLYDESDNQDYLDKLQDKIDSYKEEIGWDDEDDDANAEIGRDKLDKLEALEAEYRRVLFETNFDTVYDELIGGEPIDEDKEEFDYYVRIFQEIQAVGGQCVGISEFDGIDGIGDAANDSEWLKQMISCGKFTIDISERNAKTGQVSLKSTSVATDSGLEEVATTTIDKTAYAKAEAEYEHERKKIDQKDKRFDMDLSKLETERTALKTEYDSVKKVVQDNIERTFGIFS